MHKIFIWKWKTYFFKFFFRNFDLTPLHPDKTPRPIRCRRLIESKNRPRLISILRSWQVSRWGLHKNRYRRRANLPSSAASFKLRENPIRTCRTGFDYGSTCPIFSMDGFTWSDLCVVTFGGGRFDDNRLFVLGGKARRVVSYEVLVGSVIRYWSLENGVDSSFVQFFQSRISD